MYKYSHLFNMCSTSSIADVKLEILPADLAGTLRQPPIMRLVGISPSPRQHDVLGTRTRAIAMHTCPSAFLQQFQRWSIDRAESREHDGEDHSDIIGRLGAAGERRHDGPPAGENRRIPRPRRVQWRHRAGRAVLRRAGARQLSLWPMLGRKVASDNIC